MSFLTDFLEDVRPDVPDCLEKIIIDAVRQAAIRFCEQAYITKSPLADITLLTGVKEYALTPPANLDIVMVDAVYDSLGNQLPHVIREKMATNSSGEKPLYWHKVNTRTIQPYPTPNKDGEVLSIQAVVKPSQACLEVDDVLFNDYRLSIAAGAKERLVTMPRKEWTNFDLAPYYQNLFNEGVSEARFKIAANHVGEGQRVQPVRFG